MINMTHDEAVKFYAKKIMASGKAVGFESGEYYRPDILAIDSSLRVIEYEVKVKEPSFLSELKTIEAVRSNREKIIDITKVYSKQDIARFNRQTNKRKNKFAKHLHYLKNVHQYGKPNYRPNKFYFVLTENLYLKYKERLAKLPYGVIIITGDSTQRVKVATPIHFEQIEPRQLWHMTYHISFKLLQKENQ